MSASFCDCVNQWEQVLGLQVLKDTKHLSLWTRRDQGWAHVFTCLHHSEDISIKDLSEARCPSVVCRWSYEPCLLLLRSNVSPHSTFIICWCHPCVCPAVRWLQNYIFHKQIHRENLTERIIKNLLTFVILIFLILSENQTQHKNYHSKKIL